MNLSLIQTKIFDIRCQKVILDVDLALLYEVQTKVLNQAVKRNKDRFPSDFIFQVNRKEFEYLKSQFVTSSINDKACSWGGRRKLPFAFSEHGVTMLASVLRSERAIKMNGMMTIGLVPPNQGLSHHEPKMRTHYNPPASQADAARQLR